MALLLLLLLLSVLPGSDGCGMSVHLEVCERAMSWFDGSSFPLSGSALAHHARTVQPGAFFPDWGYSCLDAVDAAEEAHWPTFANATASYARQVYGPRPLATQGGALLGAFLFGVVSHQVSDALWHSLGVTPGMIEAVRSEWFFIL